MEIGPLLVQSVLALAIVFFVSAVHRLQSRFISSRRAAGRASLQAKRHFVAGAQLLARARSAATPSASAPLARDAVAEADRAVALDPNDAASNVLKALALELLGQPAAAFDALDSALDNPAAAATLAPQEKGDALYKRAEMLMSAPASSLGARKRQRVDLAVGDLVKAVELKPKNSKAFCLLGECYERKGMAEDAKRAFEEAARIDSAMAAAREGLGRVSTKQE